MSLKTLKTVLLALLLVSTGSQVWPCSEYVHLWRPVSEERSAMCGAEGIAAFLHELVNEKIASGTGPWLVGLSPDAVISASFSAELKRAVNDLAGPDFTWTGEGSPFNAGAVSPPTIWLDFVNPERLVYIWRDENKPPFAMFRTGEIDTARVRVLAMSAERKILFVDELPYMFLLESDLMLPTWSTNGGAWFRRVSLKTSGMAQRHEWTLSVPADMEDINTTPADIKRFYYGELSDDNTRIISNY